MFHNITSQALPSSKQMMEAQSGWLGQCPPIMSTSTTLILRPGPRHTWTRQGRLSARETFETSKCSDNVTFYISSDDTWPTEPWLCVLLWGRENQDHGCRGRDQDSPGGRSGHHLGGGHGLADQDLDITEIPAQETHWWEMMRTWPLMNIVIRNTDD